MMKTINKSYLVKTIIAAGLMFAGTFSLFAEPTAAQITEQALRQDSVDESIVYIKEQLSEVKDPFQKREVYNLLGSVQEQMALFDDAQKSYAFAAGISVKDSAVTPSKTNEQLVLDAVRCALSCGDFNTADSYLNSAVRNSKNADIQSYVKLYAQWSALCRAESVEELNEPLELLKAYLNVSSMKSIHPVILLTLWYVTGDNSWSSQLKKDFPSSTEASIVKGDVQLLPTPFWFFVPKSGFAEQGTGTFTELSEPSVEKTEEPVKAGSEKSDKTAALSKWQLGLFKTESNAKLLCDEAKGKGFDAYISTETRASGTTYYIVLVNDNAAGNVADRLRSAGYDCYMVE